MSRIVLPDWNVAIIHWSQVCVFKDCPNYSLMNCMASTKNTNTNHSTTLVLGLVTGIRLKVKQQLQITARYWCSVYSRKPIVIPVRPLFVSSPLTFFRACVSVRQSIHPHIHPFAIHSSAYPFMHSPICLFVRLSTPPSIPPSVHLFVHPYIHLFACTLSILCSVR